MMDPLGEPSQQERLSLILEAGRSIVSELSLAGVLRRVVEAARDLLLARYSALLVFGADGHLEQFLHDGLDEQTIALIGELPHGRGLLGVTAESTGILRLSDLTVDPRSVGFPPGHPVMRSFLRVPIRSRGIVFGNLYVTDRRDGADFTDDDENLVSALASTAGVAIENARLYEESRKRQEWLRASGEISSQLLQADSSHDALEQVATAVLRLADADTVTLEVAEPAPNASSTRPATDERPCVRVVVARGEGADGLAGTWYPAGGSLAAEAIRTGQSQVIDPVDHPSALLDGAPGGDGEPRPRSPMPLGPVMACPLVGDAGVRAAIVVGRRAGSRPFALVDREMAQAFAAQAAVALELADRRADHERLMMLEDRDRIARDLHDHVIQRVFAIGLTVQSAAERVDDPALQERLLRTVDDLDDTIRQIRHTIFELRRAPGQARSVRSQLQQTAESTAPSLGFSPRLLVEGPVDTVVDPSLLHDLQAVLLEGLTNVAKHAHATTATARVFANGREVTVEVSDDGKSSTGALAGSGSGAQGRDHTHNDHDDHDDHGGQYDYPDRYDPSAVNDLGPGGLFNLAVRARARGGSSVLSRGAGTTLRWSVPLPASSSRHPQEQP